MRDLVKSSNDGHWYYKETQWKMVLDCLSDALSMFSEADLNHELYLIIDHCSDAVFNLVK